ncbi:MAG: hypothetical protein DMG54_11475 [Acidobacteria bacterium]|nr:MAG: hypothetical protein DMG54_11475 [Acidobacteriota bacterium]PYU47790.1 MAG: hypothetical protein DMG53_08190 [Acidobacteriota bacterium]PYU73707.1 MAG: hypothetical protein DMG52_14550 [Acidobacteriota bacterium]
MIVAHARKLRLIGDSRRKDKRIDAQTPAQLARIDPRLLGPVRHGSAKAQIHLTVIRARAGLVSARNGPGEYGARVGEDVWRTAAQVWTWLIHAVSMRLTLVANSLCPGHEKHTMHTPQI